MTWSNVATGRPPSASAGQFGIRVSFAIAAAIVVLATVGAVLAAQRAAVTTPATAAAPGWSTPVREGMGWALSWALPLAPWVFASATLAFVTIPTRVHTGFAAPMVAGIATLIANGLSAITQIVARARRWDRKPVPSAHCWRRSATR